MRTRRFSVSESEKLVSDFTVSSIGLAVVVAVISYVFNQLLLLAGTFALLLMIIPISGTANSYTAAPAKFRRARTVAIVIASFIVVGTALIPLEQLAFME